MLLQPHVFRRKCHWRPRAPHSSPRAKGPRAGMRRPRSSISTYALKHGVGVPHSTPQFPWISADNGMSDGVKDLATLERSAQTLGKWNFWGVGFRKGVDFPVVFSPSAMPDFWEAKHFKNRARHVFRAFFPGKFRRCRKNTPLLS